MTRFVVVLLVAACGTSIELSRIDGPVPVGVDLSGQWQLRDSQRELQTRKAAQATARVFLENGRRLKVTQTEYGLFISFDRAVVEEYRFGEDRRISIGEVEAQRVSGWLGERYVIETLDDDGVILREEYWLADAGGSLMRRVTIRREEQMLADSTTRFERLSG
ncbi:MAG: hypothetical protein QNJ07_03845 [Woeseiaceae bacterium]|nr:hypothetical protein [Woeseiaceae bacterium]